jgi:DNA-binding MarR family transcriptional regulator
MTSSQEHLGFLLADVARLMRRAFQARLEGSPLTPAQARALVHVSRREGIRQVELADLLEVQPITLARLIDGLEGAGLVERRADPADRRAYQLFLRPAARSELAEILQVGAEVRAQALAGVSESQAAVLAAALDRMRDNLIPLARRNPKEASHEGTRD